MPLVKRAAWQIKRGVPDSVEIGDLIQAGAGGLLDAAKTFTPSLGRPFEAYATMKIKWAIFDELRRSDWMSRGQRDERRAVDLATQEAQSESGSPPSEEAIAAKMGVSLDEYRNILGRIQSAGIVHIEDIIEDGDDSQGLLGISGEDYDPLEQASKNQTRINLVKAISDLPEREQKIISLYYIDEMTYKEIAEVIGVSTPRVHQILEQAISRLRVSLSTPAKKQK